MSRDARWVLALLAAALAATAVVGVRVARQVKDLVATARRASTTGGEPFLYAPLDRAQDAVRAAEVVGHGGKVLLRIGQR